MELSKYTITHPASDSVGLDDINSQDVCEQPVAGDAQTIEETFSFSQEWAKAEINSYNQDTDERKRYAHRIFCLICTWLCGVFLILLLQGFRSTQFYGWFQLSQPVLLALIGSTTLNVLGVFIIVTHYLFPNATGTHASGNKSQNSSN